MSIFDKIKDAIFGRKAEAAPSAAAPASQAQNAAPAAISEVERKDYKPEGKPIKSPIDVNTLPRGRYRLSQTSQLQPT